jgi:hypothetical protein
MLGGQLDLGRPLRRYLSGGRNGNFKQLLAAVHVQQVSGPLWLVFQVGPLAGASPGYLSGGWNEAERSLLRETIGSRQPFLDFVFSHVGADGAQRKFQVSGEPMFSESCRFIGYRGIGVELTAKA